jgi:hypothetical protein
LLDKKRHAQDHVFLFANDHFSFSVRRFLRTNSTEGWYFFDGERGKIGTLIAIRERPAEWHVHGSFTVPFDPEKLWSYLVDFLLNGLDVPAAYANVHTGGVPTIAGRQFEQE